MACAWPDIGWECSTVRQPARRRSGWRTAARKGARTWWREGGRQARRGPSVGHRELPGGTAARQARRALISPMRAQASGHPGSPTPPRNTPSHPTQAPAQSAPAASRLVHGAGATAQDQDIGAGGGQVLPARRTAGRRAGGQSQQGSRRSGGAGEAGGAACRRSWLGPAWRAPLLLLLLKASHSSLPNQARAAAAAGASRAAAGSNPQPLVQPAYKQATAAAAANQQPATAAAAAPATHPTHPSPLPHLIMSAVTKPLPPCQPRGGLFST